MNSITYSPTKPFALVMRKYIRPTGSTKNGVYSFEEVNGRTPVAMRCYTPDGARRRKQTKNRPADWSIINTRNMTVVR